MTADTDRPWVLLANDGQAPPLGLLLYPLGVPHDAAFAGWGQSIDQVSEGPCLIWAAPSPRIPERPWIPLPRLSQGLPIASHAWRHQWLDAACPLAMRLNARDALDGQTLLSKIVVGHVPEAPRAGSGTTPWTRLQQLLDRLRHAGARLPIDDPAAEAQAFATLRAAPEQAQRCWPALQVAHTLECSMADLEKGGLAPVTRPRL